jgi:hypothetical protein
MCLYPAEVAGAFEAAFPASLSETVSRAAALIPGAEDASPDGYQVRVDGQDVQIPYRIYNAEPQSDIVDALDGELRNVLACLYTRHHDGHVRQRHLKRIVELTHPWVSPFVVQLVGEYVVEILLDIQAGLHELDIEGSPQRRQYGTFVAHNPAFVDLTVQRVASYWDCYYRHRYPERAAYPGSVLLSSLIRAGAEQSVE